MLKMIFGFFVIWLFLSSCASKELKTNTNQNSKPVAQTEDKSKAEQKQNDESEAITLFLAQNYKGWSLMGRSGDSGDACLDKDAPCNLHLANGKQQKIVVVMIKQFMRSDGSSYWLAYEARAIDLLHSRIDKVKALARTNALENLELDDCQQFSDDFLNAAREEREDSDDPIG